MIHNVLCDEPSKTQFSDGISRKRKKSNQGFYETGILLPEKSMQTQFIIKCLLVSFVAPVAFLSHALLLCLLSIDYLFSIIL